MSQTNYVETGTPRYIDAMTRVFKRSLRENTGNKEILFFTKICRA